MVRFKVTTFVFPLADIELALPYTASSNRRFLIKFILATSTPGHDTPGPLLYDTISALRDI